MQGFQAFRVDPKHPVAVYQQIENFVMFVIATRALKEGEALPSIREMAAMLSVNPNTVTKAYRHLEIVGLLDSRRGIGVTVRENAITKCRDTVRATAKSHLRDAVGESIASGISAQEIRKQIDRTIASGFVPYGDDRES